MVESGALYKLWRVGAWTRGKQTLSLRRFGPVDAVGRSLIWPQAYGCQHDLLRFDAHTGQTRCHRYDQKLFDSNDFAGMALGWNRKCVSNRRGSHCRLRRKISARELYRRGQTPYAQSDRANGQWRRHIVAHEKREEANNIDIMGAIKVRLTDFGSGKKVA